MTNEEYITLRENLIPLAEAHANSVSGKKPQSGKCRTLRRSREMWENRWSREFHSKMQELYYACTLNIKESK